jgi:hypothetical protein
MDIHTCLNSLLLMHKSDFDGRRISMVLDCAEGVLCTSASNIGALATFQY